VVDLDLSTISNLAEIFSASMIIVSLLFVGFQLRAANRSTHAGTIQSVTDTETRFIALAMDYADIWDRILSREAFAPESRIEIRRGVMLINFFMIDCENRFRQFKVGTLDEASWHARANNLENLFRCSIYDLWRKSPGAASRSVEFLACIDKLYTDMDVEPDTTTTTTTTTTKVTQIENAASRTEPETRESTI